MGQKQANGFDGKKAYQPQEEDGDPFVSLPEVLSPGAGG